MKQKIVFMMLVAAAFTACNKEEVKQEVNKPVPGGKIQVVIEGDVIDSPADARSTSSTVYFTGGNAIGAGLYIALLNLLLQPILMKDMKLISFMVGPRMPVQRLMIMRNQVKLLSK